MKAVAFRTTRRELLLGAVFLAVGSPPGVVRSMTGATCLAADSPFATEVLEFVPAPGHWVQVPDFSDATVALGPPVGAGTSAGDLSSVVSLGGFGGSITLAFDHTVMDDPRNRFGVDCIVFGNAFWRGSEDVHWAECAIIEVSPDSNGNGLADDLWYLIPGSHLPNPSEQRTEVTWDDDIEDPTHAPEFEEWLPPGTSGTWTTAGYRLPSEVFAAIPLTNPLAGTGSEGVYGYADYTPTVILGDMDADDETVECPLLTAEVFYTTPDDPLAVGITPGSGGGDGFDVAWAVDPATGQPAGLPGFDFLRITVAVDFVHPLFDEISTEIDAVADAAPDPFGDLDGDGDGDLADFAKLQACLDVDDVTCPPCRWGDEQANGAIDPSDVTGVVERLTGPK